MSKQPTWGVYENAERVDVAPNGHRHEIGSGSCWCGVRIEKYERPLMVHSLKTHDWFDCGMLKGRLSCRRCGNMQNSMNADGWCKGPVSVCPRGESQ